MAISLDIYKLVQTPDSQRDDEWEKAFLHSFVDAKVSFLHETPQVGPDGWPYMFVQIDPNGPEDVKKILEWISDKGIGIAVNPQKMNPDYIFTYGMLWNYLKRGEFITHVQGLKSGEVEFKAGQEVFVGEPSEDYLPPQVRTILREFFKQQGVGQPKINMVSADKSNYDICISLESIGNPPDSEHKGIAEAVSWFLPLHYSILLTSEKTFPGFIEL